MPEWEQSGLAFSLDVSLCGPLTLGWSSASSVALPCGAELLTSELICISWSAPDLEKPVGAEVEPTEVAEGEGDGELVVDMEEGSVHAESVPPASALSCAERPTTTAPTTVSSFRVTAKVSCSPCACMAVDMLFEERA